mmetsp:Transcript_30796/g.60637  ORF Transcript_30796/g.60637 Transcript_30796/m.60637 type:complete len:240 (+) Transcript_30796:1036-1755(+)
MVGPVGELAGAGVGKERKEGNHGNAAVVQLLVSEVLVLLGILGLAVGDALCALIGILLLVEELVHQGHEEEHLGPPGDGDGAEGVQGEGGADIGKGGAVSLEGKVEVGVDVAGKVDAGGVEGGTGNSEHGKAAVLELLEAVLLELGIVLAFEVEGVEGGEAGESVLAGTGSVLNAHLHGRASHLGGRGGEGEGIGGGSSENGDGSGELHCDDGLVIEDWEVRWISCSKRWLSEEFPVLR